MMADDWKCPKCDKLNTLDLLSSHTGCTYSFDTWIAHCSCGVSYEVQRDILNEEGETEPDALSMVTNECALCGDTYDIHIDSDDNSGEWYAEMRRNICEFCWEEINGAYEEAG